MSIKIQSITKIYGNQKAVNNISFEIKKGEIVGFIGPNGAGKSTTMKILTGYLSPDSGEAFINDLNVKTKGQEIKSMIGYLPEHNPLYPEMYVMEYLEYIAKLYGKTIDNGQWTMSEVIKLTGLDREKHKKIGALSKGYQQRVGLAQAIIHNPEVLILDEPTSGLDPGQIIEIRNLILSLGKDKTILLSTHLMQEVEAICDRVIMINKGKIVADENANEIGFVKDNTSTILLELDKTPDLELLNSIEGVLKIKNLDQNRLLIESTSKKDIRPLLFSFAVKNELTILSLQKKEKSLEEVFQELMR